MLERQAAAVASLKQCCNGLAADQGRLAAQAGPVLDRLDRWMTSWQNSVGQQFERVLQQNSYDHDSHSKGHKQLERLLVEGFDRCKPGVRLRNRVASGGSTTIRSTTPRTTATSKRLVPTEEVLREATVKMPLVGAPPTIPPGPEGCESGDLVRAGASGVVRMGDGKTDFQTRFCEQDTTGGGWTVGGFSPLLLLLAFFLCMDFL